MFKTIVLVSVPIAIQNHKCIALSNCILLDPFHKFYHISFSTRIWMYTHSSHIAGFHGVFFLILYPHCQRIAVNQCSYALFFPNNMMRRNLTALFRIGFWQKKSKIRTAILHAKYHIGKIKKLLCFPAFILRKLLFAIFPT